ncbi:MAG: YmdB family metallophosphoesterase [Clostridia bacterium]|nr:YmdB family metallophosphoesterase [Clostridia bacterium]
MRILAIGDVTDPRAASELASRLWEIRRSLSLDFVAVNAENAGFIVGPDPEVAQTLLDGGVDVLTGGNHTLQKKGLFSLLDGDRRVLRPANYPPEVPGAGYAILDAKGYRLLVMNAVGRVEMEPSDCPFRAVDKILDREEGNYDLAMLDFHAEASGEKMAMGYYLDGRVQAVYGTHTHVPTADEQILPHGTGYITDIGYCGPRDSILGISTEVVLHRYLTHLPERFVPAEGEIRIEGVVFTLDESARRCTKVERVVL